MQRQPRYSHFAPWLIIGYLNSALDKDHLTTWKCIMPTKEADESDPGIGVNLTLLGQLSLI
jgi:hypothetical protein